MPLKIGQQTFFCRELYSDFDSNGRHRYQAVHVIPPHGHHWYSSIWSIMAQTLASRRAINECIVSVRQQVTACFKLASVASCQPGASRAQWLPSLPTYSKAPGWQIICLKLRNEESKSHPGYRNLTTISLASGYNTSCHSETNAYMSDGDCLEVWCVPYATN
jgi:hypothetical protein